MKDVQRIGGRKRTAWLRHVVAGLALGLGAGGTLHAADFPAAVDGVLTLDLAAGVTNTYAAALPAATTLVKTGPGCAILTVASTAFTGNVDIREGTLTLADRAAAGSNTKIAVTGDAATLHLNFPRPAGAGQRTPFFTGHDVTIRGRGVDGRGAFRYTATSDGGLDDVMLESLTLSGDASLAVPSRFGIEKAINLNGHTLTRVEGGAQWMWNSKACTIDAGVISNVTATITLQDTPRFTAPSETTLCMAGGTLDFWQSAPPLPCPVVFCGGALQSSSGSDAGRNILAGPCAIEKWTYFYNRNPEHRIELTGPVTMGDTRIVQNGPGTLYLNGPVSGAKGGRLYVSSPAGRIVCSSNATRVVDAVILNATGARFDLADGELTAGWVRLGNGDTNRNTFVQSGGTLVVRGDTYVGERSGTYGAWLMPGGAATFSNEVNVAKWADSEGLLWQSGGTLAGKLLNVGRGGRGFLGVFNGATNDTRASWYGGSARLRLGDLTNGVGVVAVSGTGSVVTTEAFVMGARDFVSTNVVAVTDGGTLKARRFYRAEGAAAAARNDVYVDGGTVMPTFWTGWNHVNSSDANFFLRSPDRWTIGPRGMAIDTSEVDGGNEDDETGRLPPDWPHALSDATGRGIAAIDLPTDDADFAAAAYCGPVFVDIEGPEGSFGAAAVAAFDPAEKKLTHVVVVSPGCDYDETTRVYVRSPKETGRYACTYTLTGTRAGGRLVKRGLYGLNLHGTNTYTGGTVVECGHLYMKGEKSFPANTPLKVMDGATFDNNKRGLAVSVLGGAGGTVVNCPSVTVGEALEITAAELFAASGPLTVQGAVAFAPGVAVRVTDPENLPPHRHGASVPFLTATGGFTGKVPALDLADETGTRWTVYASGKDLRIGPVNGTFFLLR